MLSVTAATGLLRCSTGLPRLRELAAALGFTARAQPLPVETRRALGLPAGINRAALIVGHGSLRALLVELERGVTARECLSRIADAILSPHTHCLWLVLGSTETGSTTFIGAWRRLPRSTAVRALVVDREHVFASDAETLCALASVEGVPDVLAHVRWLEILGRDGLTRRFHAAMAATVHRLADDLPRVAPHSARTGIALLYVSRLLFLSFVQARGWLDGDHSFLQHAFDRIAAGPGGVHARMLEPLFFGTLNTCVSRRQPRAREFGRVPYLNGGLFSRTYVERLHRSLRFSDAALGGLFGDLLSRYRFTPREDPEEWGEAAVDPVILGQAFESLMEPRERRATGTFYTPVAVVDRALRAALEVVLTDTSADLEALLDGRRSDMAPDPSLHRRIRSLRLLDPACGSGAFLVHALRVFADVRATATGEPRAIAREAVLASSIYGVDSNPTAVWLCQLRLWLCLAVERGEDDPMSVAPLPNLDRNVRVGDSLSGSGFGDATVATHTELGRIRVRYARAQGRRKSTLAAALDVAERRAALAVVDARIESVGRSRRDLLAAARSRDLFGTRNDSTDAVSELRRLRSAARQLRAERQRLKGGAPLPFSFPAHFADVAAAGGFDLVVGNPPWVRTHRLAPGVRAQLRRRFAVCRPLAGRQSPAFGAQLDLAAPFVERALALLRDGGALALLLPAKLWSSMAGGALRDHLLRTAQLVAIDDFSGSGAMFDAATYPSLLTAARCRGGDGNARPVTVAVHRRSGVVAWRTRAAQLRASPVPSSPWLLVPPQVRRAYERLRCAGTPLGESHLGPPRLGVKTGCNEAFVVTTVAPGRMLVEVRSGDSRGWVEYPLLRPALRGEMVAPWRPRSGSREFVVWTHDARDRPLASLPPHALRWLRQWRHTLTRRADSRAASPWWQLFRTAAARSDRHRVVWCDIGRGPRALVLEPGDRTVPLNTCYVAFADETDAWALAALLNSALAAAWLRVLAEPARGGYSRYFAWTLAELPLPSDIGRFRETLAPAGRATANGTTIPDTELVDLVLDAYQLRMRDVAPLLEWRDV